MPLFQISGDRATRIEPDERRILEEKIHCQIEASLREFFGLAFVRHKPHIDGKELDTLAFDPTMRVPVIIEYKREKDRHVIDQVVGYRAKLKKDKFSVMRMLQEAGITEDHGKIDFDNPQVIIVAKMFTREQQEGRAEVSEFLRLFRYQRYENSIVSLEEVGAEEGSRTHANAPGEREPPRGGQYPLDHFGMKPEVRSLYELLDKGISDLDSRVKPAKVNKYFIGYGATGHYFCCVQPTAKVLKVSVKYKQSLPRNAGLEVRQLPSKASGPMTHTFKVSDKRQLDSALRIIRGALEDSI